MSNTTQSPEAIWNSYQQAWADIPPGERTELLARSVGDACIFVSPDQEGKGRESLTSHIEAFQQQYPGAFFKTHHILEHHRHLLAEWVMYNADGSEFLSGKSFARFDVDGRLAYLTGFWKIGSAEA